MVTQAEAVNSVLAHRRERSKGKRSNPSYLNWGETRTKKIAVKKRCTSSVTEHLYIPKKKTAGIRVQPLWLADLDNPFYPLAQCWVKGAAELQGEQLEHMPKNRNFLQAVKGEVTEHTPSARAAGMCFWQRGQRTGSSQILCAALTCIPQHNSTLMEEEPGGRKVQISVGKGKSAGFSFALPQRT